MIVFSSSRNGTACSLSMVSFEKVRDRRHRSGDDDDEEGDEEEGEDGEFTEADVEEEVGDVGVGADDGGGAEGVRGGLAHDFEAALTAWIGVSITWSFFITVRFRIQDKLLDFFRHFYDGYFSFLRCRGTSFPFHPGSRKREAFRPETMSLRWLCRSIGIFLVVLDISVCEKW